MSKTKRAAAAAPKTRIMIAANELRGGGVVVASGDELTEDLAAEIGLDADGIAALLASGGLREVDAHRAVGAGDAELAEAIARAETAEAEVATLTAKVGELEVALAAAKKA